MPIGIALCAFCRHRNVATCLAFPGGIPSEFLGAERDHRAPYPGDNGILFEIDPDLDPDLKEMFDEHFQKAPDQPVERATA